ncbi:lysylphosphatidylglycerol synthase transmembrane domain-containing protein [Patescibacteria group bacterium]
MKRFLLFLISLLVGIGLLSFTLKYVGLEEIKNAFRVFTGWHGLIIFGLTLLMILVGTWKWKEILSEEGVKIPTIKLIKPYLAGFSVTFLAPMLLWGGEIFRGYFLKEKHSVPWAKGMASVIIDRMMEWTASLVVIIFGLLFFFYKISLPPQKIGIIIAVVFFIFAGGVFYFYFKVFKKESILEVLLKIFGLGKIKEKAIFLEIEKETFKFFKLENRKMWFVFFLSLLRSAVMLIRAWVLIIFLGKNIGWIAALSVLGFSYISSLIPIPTALGSHEIIQTFVFSSLGLGFSSATAFAMILRGSEFLVSLLGLTILFKQGIEFFNNFIFKKMENFINNKDESKTSSIEKPLT